MYSSYLALFNLRYLWTKKKESTCDFPELEKNVRDKSYGPQACALLEQIKAQIGLRREQITSHSISVEEELKQVISRLQSTAMGPEMVENQAWIAVQAG